MAEIKPIESPAIPPVPRIPNPDLDPNRKRREQTPLDEPLPEGDPGTYRPDQTKTPQPFEPKIDKKA